MAYNSQPWGRVTTDSDAARRRGHDFAYNQERWRPFEEGGWTAKMQLDAMDMEGIDVAVIYPSRGLFALTIPNMDPRLAAAMARAYNNWLHEFCQENPDRLIGAGMISPFDVQDAVAETRRCIKELGFRGVFLRPNEVIGTELA
jgi:predicted TIM-barrel fold metal-dependent hydrolase